MFRWRPFRLCVGMGGPAASTIRFERATQERANNQERRGPEATQRADQRKSPGKAAKQGACFQQYRTYRDAEPGERTRFDLRPMHIFGRWRYRSMCASRPSIRFPRYCSAMDASVSRGVPPLCIFDTIRSQPMPVRCRSNLQHVTSRDDLIRTARRSPRRRFNGGACGPATPNYTGISACRNDVTLKVCAGQSGPELLTAAASARPAGMGTQPGMGGARGPQRAQACRRSPASYRTSPKSNTAKVRLERGEASASGQSAVTTQPRPRNLIERVGGARRNRRCGGMRWFAAASLQSGCSHVRWFRQSQGDCRHRGAWKPIRLSGRRPAAVTARRAMEDAAKVKVVDRTAVILRTSSPSTPPRVKVKAQVELAQLEYMLPRLRGWGGCCPVRPAVSAVGAGCGHRIARARAEQNRNGPVVNSTRIARLRRQIRGMALARDGKRSSRRRFGLRHEWPWSITNASQIPR